MKMVVLDGYTENPGDLSWDALRRFGELTVYDRTELQNDALMIERAGDAEIVLVNKTPLRRTVIENCPKLKLICILATGFNAVDCACAAERGIPVCNVPAYGTDAVAQHTIALLLEICNRVAHHSSAVREGRWERARDYCFWDYPLMELSGKTIGIIGFGRIGQQTGRIARAMGMRVLACSPTVREETKEIGEYVDLDTLLRESDVISLHCPMKADTQEIICRKTIEKMKDGVILINSSRGKLIREQDLADALAGGKIYGAAVDVVSEEPILSDNPLLKAPNCIITPHIAWTPIECRQRVMDCTADNIQAWLSGQPIHVVNGL